MDEQRPNIGIFPSVDWVQDNAISYMDSEDLKNSC